jgi:hypothetical protein
VVLAVVVGELIDPNTAEEYDEVEDAEVEVELDDADDEKAEELVPSLVASESDAIDAEVVEVSPVEDAVAEAAAAEAADAADDKMELTCV